MLTLSGATIPAAGICRIGVNSPQRISRREQGCAVTTAISRTGRSAAARRGARGGAERVEDDANKGVVAMPKRNRAADECERRQRELRHLVGPEKRRLEEGARDHVDEHGRELAEQGDRQHRVGDRDDGAGTCLAARPRSDRPRTSNGAGVDDFSVVMAAKSMAAEFFYF